MKANVFLIRCISNMRVGNGDVNYSLIDNEVERDPVLTGVPVIHSSGVKGAIREHFERKLRISQSRKEETGTPDSGSINRIFGGEGRQGEYKFLQATTLFRPLRVTAGNVSYIEATSPELMGCFNSAMQALNADVPLLNLDKDFWDSEGGYEGYFGNRSISGIEGKPIGDERQREAEIHRSAQTDSGMEHILTKAFAGTTAGSVTDPTNYYVTSRLNQFDLPVQARNFLDDGGQSRNLWYEEVVPHETILWFAILTPADIDPKIMNSLTEDIFQFGGSASVGYGLTRIIPL